MLSYMFFMYFSEIHQSILWWSNFQDLVEKEQLNLTSTGLIIGIVCINFNNLYLVPNKSPTISFWILEAVLLWKTINVWVSTVQSPEDQGDFGQGLKPQDSFGGFDNFSLSIFRKYTKPSESTIKPTKNWFEWHVLMQYCTSWNFRGGFIFANFTSQTLAKISTSVYVYL